jgi:glycerol uptake facilitator-like aquaporin
MMTAVKRYIWVLTAGALLGAVTFAWFSPSLIEWYFSPPSDLAFSCKPAVQWGIHAYRKVVFTGMLMGGIAATILFFAFFKRKPPARTVAADLGEREEP